MLTLAAWIEAQEHVDIDTLASEDRACGICYKNYQDKVAIPFDTKIKTKDAEAEETECCVCPVKLSCGHIMGAVCLLKWLIPYPRGGNGNSCPMCRDTFFAPWPQQPGIQNHVADISDDTAEQNAQEQQDLASSDAASEGQDSDGDHWVENRWMGYDEWDQENYSDPFWTRIDAPR